MATRPRPRTIPPGESFTFEYGAAKQDGGQGFADVWKRGYFGWEYKGKHADLDDAYSQLLQYRDALENPPLLVVCDIDRIVDPHQLHQHGQARDLPSALDDLLADRPGHSCAPSSTTPSCFRPAQTPEEVTEDAAAEFARLAESLRQRGTRRRRPPLTS